MKRKLISYDAFEKIQKESISFVETELVEAEVILSRLLGEAVQLSSFDVETVVYESEDGNYLHANYTANDDYLTFDNIEQLVIDSDSELVKSKETLSEMLEALASDEEQKAKNLFESYLAMPNTKRMLCETKKRRRVPIRKNVGGKTKIVGYKTGMWNVTPKHHEPSANTARRLRGKKKAKLTTSKGEKKLRSLKRSRIKLPHMKEWSNLCENVFDFVNIRENRHAFNECSVNRDERGNITSVRIPTRGLQSEGKILTMNWKTLSTDVKVLRNNAKKLKEDFQFGQAVAQLKTNNAVSDNTALEENLSNIVSQWPQVLYLTQAELAESIRDVLEALDVKNFDDQTCIFMAEGILRVAHESYTDRVSRVVKLAGQSLSEDSGSDKYIEFQDIVGKFYSTLDESNGLEMQIFVDLYEALREVHALAVEDENKLLASEITSHLRDLASVIEQEIDLDLDVATDAADFLSSIVETNLETSKWVVPGVHQTETGDHPDLMGKATKSYTPSSDFSGNWGKSHPVSDGKNYKGAEVDELENRGWANVGGEDTYPTLTNPYLPKEGDFTMKGAKGVDKDSDGVAQWGSEDTWPNLSNPYLPKSVIPKLNQGKEKSVVEES